MFFFTSTKIRVILVCALGFLGGVSSTEAQPMSSEGQSRLVIRGTAGTVVPTVTKQFSGFYSTGGHFSLGVGYFVRPSLEVQIRATHARFTLDEAGVNDLVDGFIRQVDWTVSGGAGTMWSGSVNVRFHSPVRERLGFQLNGGVGLYQHSLYDATLVNSDDRNDTLPFQAQEQTSPGVNLGAGVAWSLTPRIQLSIAPKFVLVFGDRVEDERVFEQTGRFGFLTIQGGVDVRF